MKKSNGKISIEEKKFLRRAVANIVKGFHPRQILLFGSHAHGKPGPDSDLDLLIVKDTRLPVAERARRVSQFIGRHVFPLDLIVLTPGEIRSRLRGFDPFLEEALNRGRILYDKNR